MTQDPKKLPNWLRGKKKQQEEAPPPNETPQDSAPPPADTPQSGGDDAALPPWLRKDAPPPPPAPSKVRRLAPPAPEQPGGVPPWLAGMDESKSYKIGGTELSEEYLKGGDELPDSLDSEMTYDSWMADQLESKREKDIEEEVPDLLSSITPDDSFSRPEGKQTGQLPDWFLGLEELETTEAPDWFSAGDPTAKPAVSADAMPPWINDMVEQQPEPEPIDEIGSFFNSLGGGDVAEAEADEEIDWFNHPEDDEVADDPDNIPGVPTDDFFTQLVSGSRPTPIPSHPAEPPRPTPEVRPPPRQQIELPDIDDDFGDDFIEDEVQARPAVEIPQNELDAFFDNVAAGRSSTPVDDIEEPDMEWIVPSEPVVEELPEEPEIYFEPEPEAPSAAQEEDTMSWLSQLQNIVSSASRPAEPVPEESVTLGTLDTWDAPPEEAKAEQVEGEFAWPDAPYQEPPAPEETQETEWLSTITPDDAAVDESTVSDVPASPPAPASPRSSLLSARLARAQEPPPPVPSGIDEDDLPDLFSEVEAFPADAMDEGGLIPDEELQSGWMTDDLFNESEPAASVETSNDNNDDDEDFFSRLQTNSDANVLEDAQESAQDQWGGQEDALADADFLNDLSFEQPAAAPASQFGQWDDSPSQSSAEPQEDDFFASLGIDEPATAAAPEEDALGQWSAQQSSAEPLEDDFFASLGGSEQPAASQNEQYGQWDAQQSEAEPLEDDFLSSLGMTDTQPATSQDTQFGQWDAQQNEAEPLEDDFLTSLGLTDEESDASDEDTGEWGIQQSEAERQEENFYTLLGMNDAELTETAKLRNIFGEAEAAPQVEAEPAEDEFLETFGMADEDQPAASNESLFGQWEDAPQTEAASTEDDLFATFGTNEDEDQPTASNESLFGGQWEDAPQTEAASTEDDLFATFGTNEDEDNQPATASNESLFGQWAAEPQADAEPAEDDLFPTFGMTDEDEDNQPAASNESLFGQWAAEPQADAEPAEDDLFPTFGTDEDEDNQPAASNESLFGGQWEDQPSEEALQEDDFFQRLGLNDDDEDDAPPTVTSEPEQYGQWQSDAAPQSDDFFAALSLDDGDQVAQPAAQDDQFGWYNETVEEEAPPANQAPQEDNFLSSLGFKDDENAALPASSDDIFAQWDDQAQPEVAPLDDNFFASLDPDAQPAKAEQDPYAQWDTEAADMPPTEDFFSALGLISEADNPDEVAASPQWDGQEAPSEEDFFSSLGMLSDDQQPTQPMPPGNKNEPQSYGDVDSYLASLNMGESDITPTTDDLYSGSDSMDIDALFSSEPVMRDRPKAETAAGETLAGANEDWLNQLQASVGEVSASAIVRQKEDRPVEELSDRLKKLRAKAEQISDEAPEQASNSLTEMIPSGQSSLSSAPFIEVTPTAVEGVALTSEQQTKVKLLKTLVPADTRGDGHISAIEATYDSPFMADLEDDDENIVLPTKIVEEAPAKPRTRRRQRQRIRLDRVLIAAVIALAVIVPFTIRGFRVGDLPPSSFAAGSSEKTAFSQIDGLKAGDLVLVGLEYGPTSAAELDGMTTALLRHILMKAAYPVIISGNPLTILRSEDLMASINADGAFLKRIGATQPLAANSDFYIIRYLPGSVIGLRAFSQDTANLILSDVQGQATGLVIRSMRDFALVTVVTDRADDLRAYAEQIAPLTRAPLISAVSYGAAPLAEPYIHTMGGGLLVGYRDAYTYNDLLDSVSARSITQQNLRIIPTEIPTEVPVIAQPNDTGSAEATAEAGSNAGTGEPIGTATVIARQAVNMRSGAGTTNPVIATVASGSVLSVLGLSDDRAWVHVTQDNGQDGWISAALLSLDIKETLRERPETHAKRQQLDPDDPTATPRSTRAPATPSAPTEAATVEALAGTETVIPATATTTPRPTATATATLEPTEEATAVPAVYVPPPPPSPGYRDERWYAMNLGIIASTLIITLGAVVNILRQLLRRGRRG